MLVVQLDEAEAFQQLGNHATQGEEGVLNLWDRRPNRPELALGGGLGDVVRQFEHELNAVEELAFIVFVAGDESVDAALDLGDALFVVDRVRSPRGQLLWLYHFHFF